MFFTWRGYWPWSVARRLFDDREVFRIPPRRGDRWGFRRSLAGLASLFVVDSIYNSSGNPLLEARDKLPETALLTLAVAVVLLLVLFALTERRFRSVLLSRMKDPARTVGLAFVLLGVPYIAVLKFVGTAASRQVGTWQLVVGLLILYWFIFFLFSSYFLGRFAFSVGRVNPMYAPVGTFIVVVVDFVLDLISFDTEALPVMVWLATKIAAVASTGVLAFIEYRDLEKNGVSLFGSPDSVVGP